MNHIVTWINDEEGMITFLEGKQEFLRAYFYVTGEEEAEFSIQDIVPLAKQEDGKDIPEEIILKVSRCVCECFLLLWNRGFEETVLTENKMSKYTETLNSTGVVERAYSEYMMEKQLCVGTTTISSDSCSMEELRMTEREEIRVYETENNSFSCKVYPYREGWYLCEVEVREELRNQGIATNCLLQVFSELSKTQDTKIYLQVGSYNEPAVHLYKKLGFEVTEELCSYVLTEETEEQLLEE